MGSESNRMWASASFVGVLIIIGLPLWWKTTEVYRVSLPYEQINAFSPLSQSMAAELTVVANDDATAADIAGLVEKSFGDQDVIKLKITKLVVSDTLRHTLESVADEQEAVEEVAAAFDLERYNTFLVVQRPPLFEQVWVGAERVAFFRNSDAGPTLAKVLKSWIFNTEVLTGARADSADAARRVRFPPAASYHVLLSVVQANADMQLDFNAKEIMEDYIGSFVDELNMLHNFTLKSQWLHLVDFDFQATEVKDNSEYGRHFATRVDRLPLLLTRLEERLATHVAPTYTANLAAYVLPCHKSPLMIYDENDRAIPTPVQAFLSPKWGGVALLSPPAPACVARRWAPDVRLLMGTFISQLRTLFGIAETQQIPGAHLSPSRGPPPRAWERCGMLRLRIAEQRAAAQRTLASLAQLLGEISNIVINDEVGASINSAVSSIHLADKAANDGDLELAYKASLEAFLAAEAAFMDPSLLALLYFPDDQKYAIYIPLFLPIMFPVLLSLKNLLLWLRGKKTTKQKTE